MMGYRGGAQQMLTSVSMEAKLATVVVVLGNLSPEKVSSRVKFRKCVHTG